MEPKEVIELVKAVGKVEATALESHNRLDRFENQYLAELKDIRTTMGEVKAWMYKTQGRDSTLFVVGSVVGGVVSWLLSYLMKGGH